MSAKLDICRFVSDTNFGQRRGDVDQNFIFATTHTNLRLGLWLFLHKFHDIKTQNLCFCVFRTDIYFATPGRDNECGYDVGDIDVTNVGGTVQ